MIEESLVAAIRAAVPAATVHANLVPQGDPLPWVVYRQTDAGESTESFSSITHTAVFEIDIAAEKGLEPENYRAVKAMAMQLQEALRYGFDHSEGCVYRVAIDKQQDMIDDVDSLHWVRASYSLTYDTLT